MSLFCPIRGEVPAMSWTALLESEAACAEGDAPQPPLEWLLAMLRQAMEELMADEAAKPLQKANAIARMGSLYLKTYQAAELVKENKVLLRRVAELEEALERGSGPGGTLSGTPEPAPALAGPLPPAPVPAAMQRQVARAVTAEPGVQPTTRGRPSGPVSRSRSRFTTGSAPGPASPAPG